MLVRLSKSSHRQAVLNIGEVVVHLRIMPSAGGESHSELADVEHRNL